MGSKRQRHQYWKQQGWSRHGNDKSVWRKIDPPRGVTAFIKCLRSDGSSKKGEVRWKVHDGVGSQVTAGPFHGFEQAMKAWQEVADAQHARWIVENGR